MAKNLASLRWLADGSSLSSLDEQLRMNIESLRKCFYAIFSAINKCYNDKHLNRISEDSELALIEQNFSKSLFLGCIGSLNFLHVNCKN